VVFCYNKNMLNSILIVFISAIVFGSLLESGYRSYEARKFVFPKFWNIQMYVWIGFVLYFLYISEINFIYKAIIIIIFATGIEYITGYLYLKNKKQRLWDYSYEKYNYQGIICLKFSFYWLFLCCLYYFLFLPLIIY
jgi:uncharacterized membrane protein